MRLRGPTTRQRVRETSAIACLLTSIAIVAAGCSSSSRGADGGGKPEVVATTSEIGDWVRIVGGEQVNVDQVLQPNTDPHDYEPRPQDVVGAAGAAIVFASGDGLDSWIDQIVDGSGSDARVVDLGRSVPVERAGDRSGPEASDVDPHWWHDPVNAIAAVREIERRLSDVDRAGADTFQRNAAAYVARLRALDAGIKRCMDRVPPEQRLLVTDHDAFGYFADRYGIEVVGAAIPSQATEAQASAGETADLIRLIDQRGVKAIFPESSLNSKLAETIAEQTAASSGYTLYGDTLGAAGSDGATYLTMEAANADAMVRGFTGGRDRCHIHGLGGAG